LYVSVIITVHSSVGIVTRLADRGIRLRVLVGTRDFIFSGALGVHALSYEMSARAIFPGLRLKRHEADHSPLVPKLKVSEFTLLSHTSSWCDHWLCTATNTKWF
jgi:hypothetical protein